MINQQGQKGSDYRDIEVGGISVRIRFAKNWRHIVSDHAAMHREPWSRILPAAAVKDIRLKGKRSDQKRVLKEAVLTELSNACERAMLIIYDVTDVENRSKTENIEALGPSGLSMYCRFRKKTEIDENGIEREVFELSTAMYKVQAEKSDGILPLWLKVAKKRINQIAPHGEIVEEIYKKAGRKKYLREAKEHTFNPIDQENWGFENERLSGRELPNWQEAERFYSGKTLGSGQWHPPQWHPPKTRRTKDQRKKRDDESQP